MVDHAANLEEIVQRASAGDAEAMACTFERFRVQLKQSVCQRLHPSLYGRLDPSDVIQETFLDAQRRLSEYASDPRIPLFLWFRLLVAQRIVDLHRQHLGAQMRDVSLEVSLDQPTAGYTSSVWLRDRLVDRISSASSTAIRFERRQAVREALDGMEPLDREVLAMRHFDMLSNQEVALLLGLTKTAASNRYLRALQRLKEILPQTEVD